MGLFDYFGGARYPHTNWNILNLDWVMEKIRALTDSQGEVTEAAQAATTAANNATTAANNANSAAQAATTAAQTATQKAEDALESAINFTESGELALTMPEGYAYTGAQRFRYALSSNKRYLKVYGTGITIRAPQVSTSDFVYFRTNLQLPSRQTPLTISAVGTQRMSAPNPASTDLTLLSNVTTIADNWPAIRINANGSVDIRAYILSSSSGSRVFSVTLYPAIYQIRDFGD